MTKTLIKIFCAVALPLIMNACGEKDYGDADLTKVPSIDAYKSAITVKVDQTTNLVTLNMDSKEIMPVWIFSDGSTSSENNYQMTVRNAGTYTMRAKVANKYGISDGTVTLTYTLNNTLFDMTLIKYLCGGTGTSTKQWVWNSAADGHFGCGPSYSNPTGWWSCGANGKAGVGMYDDIFTFGYAGSGLTGTYQYDPGTGGTIYVNSGCTFSPFNAYNTNNGNDYPATVSVQNASWTFKYEGNDLYLTFPANTLLGYMPNIETYNTPKFKIISVTNDKLSMACFNGGIAWKYEFIPK
jgi:hypothetical protein